MPVGTCQVEQPAVVKFVGTGAPTPATPVTDARAYADAPVTSLPAQFDCVAASPTTRETCGTACTRVDTGSLVLMPPVSVAELALALFAITVPGAVSGGTVAVITTIRETFAGIVPIEADPGHGPPWAPSTV
jgi:hypothetical protein